eukprot:gb/GECG01003706.1/.p1 GENE.gb/GECG01003706.1/~~gb/GECG01003706.1/.p1  ORF type:complete len:2343 (+),score=252.67 gb/GECG01003706.1/:1-7029(+)
MRMERSRTVVSLIGIAAGLALVLRHQDAYAEEDVVSRERRVLLSSGTCDAPNSDTAVPGCPFEPGSNSPCLPASSCFDFREITLRCRGSDSGGIFGDCCSDNSQCDQFTFCDKQQRACSVTCTNDRECPIASSSGIKPTCIKETPFDQRGICDARSRIGDDGYGFCVYCLGNPVSDTCFETILDYCRRHRNDITCNNDWVQGIIGDFEVSSGGSEERLESEECPTVVCNFDGICDEQVSPDVCPFDCGSVCPFNKTIPNNPCDQCNLTMPNMTEECVPKTAVFLGQEFGACCDGDTQCDSGVCDWERRACTVPCRSDSECPPEPISGKRICTKKNSLSTGKCAARSGPMEVNTGTDDRVSSSYPGFCASCVGSPPSEDCIEAIREYCRPDGIMPEDEGCNDTFVEELLHIPPVLEEPVFLRPEESVSGSAVVVELAHSNPAATIMMRATPRDKVFRPFDEPVTLDEAGEYTVDAYAKHSEYLSSNTITFHLTILTATPTPSPGISPRPTPSEQPPMLYVSFESLGSVKTSSSGVSRIPITLNHNSPYSIRWVSMEPSIAHEDVVSRANLKIEERDGTHWLVVYPHFQVDGEVVVVFSATVEVVVPHDYLLPGSAVSRRWSEELRLVNVSVERSSFDLAVSRNVSDSISDSFVDFQPFRFLSANLWGFCNFRTFSGYSYKYMGLGPHVVYADSRYGLTVDALLEQWDGSTSYIQAVSISSWHFRRGTGASAGKLFPSVLVNDDGFAIVDGQEFNLGRRNKFRVVVGSLTVQIDDDEVRVSFVDGSVVSCRYIARYTLEASLVFSFPSPETISGGLCSSPLSTFSNPLFLPTGAIPDFSDMSHDDIALHFGEHWRRSFSADSRKVWEQGLPRVFGIPWIDISSRACSNDSSYCLSDLYGSSNIIPVDWQRITNMASYEIPTLQQLKTMRRFDPNGFSVDLLLNGQRACSGYFGSCSVDWVIVGTDASRQTVLDLYGICRRRFVNNMDEVVLPSANMRMPGKVSLPPTALGRIPFTVSIAPDIVDRIKNMGSNRPPEWLGNEGRRFGGAQDFTDAFNAFNALNSGTTNGDTRSKTRNDGSGSFANEAPVVTAESPAGGIAESRWTRIRLVSASASVAQYNLDILPNLGASGASKTDSVTLNFCVKGKCFALQLEVQLQSRLSVMIESFLEPSATKYDISFGNSCIPIAWAWGKGDTDRVENDKDNPVERLQFSEMNTTLEGPETMSASPLYSLSLLQEDNLYEEKEFEVVNPTVNDTTLCLAPESVVSSPGFFISSRPYCHISTSARYITKSDLFSIVSVERWQTGSWSSCQSFCGPGIKTRDVWCGINSSFILPDSSCSSTLRPSEWTVCSTDINCQNGTNPTNSFVAGPWSDCSADCGYGIRHRTVACASKEGEILEDDSLCLSLNTTVPSSNESCIARRCHEYEWITSGWSDCDSTCGPGEKERTVLCKDKISGRPVSASLCDANQRPGGSKSCSNAPCGRVKWKVSSWSNCNVTCGGGIRNRTVTCLKTDSTEELPDIECIVELDDKKPARMTECNTQSCLKPRRSVSSWSDCEMGSGSCTNSTGIQNRNVTCLDSLTSEILSASECAHITMPVSTKKCTPSTCGPCDTLSCMFGECVVDRDGNPECLCWAGWLGDACDIKQTNCTEQGGLVLPTGSCCQSGAINSAGDCCHPAGEGITPVIDSEGECCPEGSSALDAIGICNGTAAAVDRNGDPCTTQLGADGICCESGQVDACGVCEGDGSSCSCVHPLKLFANESEISGAEVLALGDGRGPDNEMFNEGSQKELAEAMGVSVSIVHVKKLSVISRDQIALEVMVGPRQESLSCSSLNRKLWNTLSENPLLATFYVEDVFPPVSTQPQCDNGVCEIGELCSQFRKSCCKADCGAPLQECPGYNGQPCSGKGVCISSSGTCKCNLGYSGEDCSTCARHSGFRRVSDSKDSSFQCVQTADPPSKIRPGDPNEKQNDEEKSADDEELEEADDPPEDEEDGAGEDEEDKGDDREDEDEEENDNASHGGTAFASAFVPAMSAAAALMVALTLVFIAAKLRARTKRKHRAKVAKATSGKYPYSHGMFYSNPLSVNAGGGPENSVASKYAGLTGNKQTPGQVERKPEGLAGGFEVYRSNKVVQQKNASKASKGQHEPRSIGQLSSSSVKQKNAPKSFKVQHEPSSIGRSSSSLTSGANRDAQQERNELFNESHPHQQEYSHRRKKEFAQHHPMSSVSEVMSSAPVAGSRRRLKPSQFTSNLHSLSTMDVEQERKALANESRHLGRSRRLRQKKEFQQVGAPSEAKGGSTEALMENPLRSFKDSPSEMSASSSALNNVDYASLRQLRRPPRRRTKRT